MSDRIVHPTALTAAILVGGRSRRMGEDKALIRLRADGPTLIETVVAVVRAIADEVVLVGARDGAYDVLDLPNIPDLIPNTGALGGIHAALAGMAGTHLLVVGCDMPFLNANLLRFMRDHAHDYDVLVPITDQPHPLHAIYSASCLSAIERNLHAGNNRVMGWWDAVNVQEIPTLDIARYDPGLRSVFNMNTPDDLALAQAITRESTPGNRESFAPECGQGYAFCEPDAQ